MSTVVWLVGPPASGKSTIATALQHEIIQGGLSCMVLDADETRKVIGQELTFTRADREENTRRLSYVAAWLVSQGIMAVCSSTFHSPQDRGRLQWPTLFEVHVTCPHEICEERDKARGGGLYERGRAGLLPDFPDFVPPTDPAVMVDTSKVTVTQAVGTIMWALRIRDRLRKR